MKELAKNPVRAPAFPVFNSYTRAKDEPAEEGECWSDEDGILEGSADNKPRKETEVKQEEDEAWSDEEGLLDSKENDDPPARMELCEDEQACAQPQPGDVKLLTSNPVSLVEAWSSSEDDEDDCDLNKDLLLSSSPAGPDPASEEVGNPNPEEGEKTALEEFESISSPE